MKSYLKWLLVPWAVYFAVMAFCFITYTIGGCRGGLGSGITCSRGSAWGAPWASAEVSALIAPILWVFYALIVSTVFGVVALLRRRSGRP